MAPTLDHATTAPPDAELFEAIVGTVRQPLLALDDDLTVRYANRGFRDFFGASNEKILGASIYTIGAGAWDTPNLRGLLAWIRDSGLACEDHPLEIADPGHASRSMLVNARPVAVAGEGLILLTAEDVTERDSLERLVAERTSELEAFNYSVSHDLRAPLRALDGFSRALLEDCAAELSPEGQRYLELISSNAGQMGALIDGLLAFSRLGRQGMTRTPVEVRPLVEAVLADLAPELEGRDVTFELGDLPVADADPLLLRQIFANLIGNALKFTRATAAARIEVTSHIVDGERVWTVADNGVGFDMAFADRLFETFQRLHRSEDYEGTGIGLAFVQLIVRRHDGEVWADATVGSGATFSFTLPAGGA